MRITKTDCVVLIGINKYEHELSNLSIYQLADKIHTSPSAISKACQKFGFSCFKNMKLIMLHKYNSNHLNIIDIFIELHESLQGSLELTLNDLYSLSCDLEYTSNSLLKDELYKILCCLLFQYQKVNNKITNKSLLVFNELNRTNWYIYTKN